MATLLKSFGKIRYLFVSSQLTVIVVTNQLPCKWKCSSNDFAGQETFGFCQILGRIILKQLNGLNWGCCARLELIECDLKRITKTRLLPHNCTKNSGLLLDVLLQVQSG